MKYSWVEGVIKVLLEYETKKQYLGFKMTTSWIWMSEKETFISGWKFLKENKRMEKEKKTIITGI